MKGLDPEKEVWQYLSLWKGCLTVVQHVDRYVECELPESKKKARLI